MSGMCVLFIVWGAITYRKSQTTENLKDSKLGLGTNEACDLFMKKAGGSAK